MTSDVGFPAHLHASLQRLGPHTRAALLVRHAERGPIVDVTRHEEILLTPAGHAAARQAGRSIAFTGTKRVFHSPVERCAETARGIVLGLRDRDVPAHASEVGMLGAHYIRDVAAGKAYAQRLGSNFLRSWFSGVVPPDVFRARADAARMQLRAIVEVLMHERPGLDVMVTHDWNIALLREEFMGLVHESYGWPGFLDGVLVVTDGHEAHLHVGAHSTTLTMRAL